MATTQARRAARKSSSARPRKIDRETRRKLFLETLEDRRLLAGLDESVVSGPPSLVIRHSSLVIRHWSRVPGPMQMTKD